jgi:uncharacterized protein (UPF0332 family)
MTGDEFLTLAGRIVATPTLGNAEARLRTATSRAYYGAFHLAVAILATWGFKVKRNAYGHQEVYNLFWGSGHSEARKVASLLDDLRTERIAADYRMDDQRFSESETAMMCVEMGLAVRLALERCQSEASAIQEGIRQWRFPTAGQRDHP